jgi:hypothetical protein
VNSLVEFVSVLVQVHPLFLKAWGFLKKKKELSFGFNRVNTKMGPFRSHFSPFARQPSTGIISQEKGLDKRENMKYKLLACL